MRTQVVLSRLAEHNPAEYEGWTFSDLAAALATHEIRPRKSDGYKVLRAEDLSRAITGRTATQNDERDGSANRDTPGRQGVLPDGSLIVSPGADQHKPEPGTRQGHTEIGTETRCNPRARPWPRGSLPQRGGGADGT